jgi:hypothetical protein
MNGGHRLVAGAAATALVGAILSGPVSVGLVAATHPQPLWRGVEAFVEAYHPVQALPYVLGFSLIGGFAALMAALHEVAPPASRARTGAAKVFAGAAAAMVLTNYAMQIAVVPGLMRSSAPGEASLVALLTMANPASVGWGLEMWGYAVLGVATWLAAEAFGRSRLERACAALFRLNGVVSVGAALYSAVRPGWVSSPAGLWNFAIWNVLVIVMLALIVLHARRDPRAPDPEGGRGGVPR